MSRVQHFATAAALSAVFTFGCWLMLSAAPLEFPQPLAEQRPTQEHIALQPASPQAAPLAAASPPLPDLIDDPAIAPRADFPAMGDEPLIVPEPLAVIDRSTPTRLLQSLFDARARKDRAALVRISLSTRDLPEIRATDAAWAQRAYLWGSVAPLWDKIEAAFDNEDADFDVGAQNARVSFPLGGALGVLTREFVRHEDGWYLVAERRATLAAQGGSR